MISTLAYLLPRAALVSQNSRIGKLTSGRPYVSFIGGQSAEWTIPYLGLYQGGAVSLLIQYATPATSGTVKLSAAIEALSQGDYPVSTLSSFGSPTDGEQNLSGQAWQLRSFNCPFSDVDGMVQGRLIRIKITRETDTCTQPVYIVGATLQETLSSFQIDGELVLQTPLAVSSGGTGADNAGDALNGFLPNQSGHNGDFLSSDGSAVSWATVPATTPAGSNTQLQFNSSGSFGATSNLTFDSSTSLLALSGKQTITSNSSSAILLSIKGTSGQSGNYFQVKDSTEKLVTALDSTGRWLIPDGGSYSANQKLTFKASNDSYAGSAVLEVRRATNFTSNGFGSILKLADNNAACDVRMMARTFVQGLYDLEFTNYLGQKVFGSPYLGGCYFWNGSAYSNLNEAAMTIPEQTMAPGGGGAGYIYQAPLAVEQCLYFLNGVTKVEHLSSIWVEGPPTFHAYYTNPENAWSLDCGIGRVKATGFASWYTTTGTGAKQRAQFSIQPTWVVSTEGSQTSETYLCTNDTAERTVMTLGANGSAPTMSFFGVSPVARQSATDLAEVITALQAYGLLT